MTSVQTGKRAEQAAAVYLQNLGWKLLDTNWRRRSCEIDIVALRRKTIYFVEVKYRKSYSSGSGLDYITSRKLAQMSYAAEMWVSEAQWNGPYQLSAVEVAGESFAVTAFLSEL